MVKKKQELPPENVVAPENDNISKSFSDIVPEEFRGTDRYLDVVQWNLEWFGASKSRDKDVRRYGLVLDILSALNADLFVFQEVAGPSYDGRYKGALDDIAEELTKKGAGDYAVYYTRAGGEQRVAMMWDRDWLRAKTDVKELFPQGTHITPDGKDAFAKRTPLYGFFSANVPSGAATRRGDGAKFEFQALGVHLKAMPEGKNQRLHSAEVLSKWMTQEATKVDADIMIMGDWNAPPEDDCWAPFHKLEGNQDVRFRDINDPSDFSYLWCANRTNKLTSRIDLTAMSLASANNVVGEAAQVVRWKPIQDVIAQAGKLSDKRVVQVMEEMKETISDHLPTVSRFYFSE